MPGSPPAVDARRPRRPTRRGRRGGWRARQARERERRGGQLTEASEQLTARGTGATPCRKECHRTTDQKPPDVIYGRYHRAAYPDRPENDTELASPPPQRPISTRTLSRPPRLTITQTNGIKSAAKNSSRGPNTGKLRVGTINAQSLVPKLDLVIDLLQQEALDVLCVCESWLHPGITSRFLVFPGYNIVRRDRPPSSSGHQSRGGGVAIILRQDIQYQMMNTATADQLEALWLSVSWPGGRPSVVGAIYRPPAGSVRRAVDQMQEQLRTALATQKPLLLLGDININVLDSTSPATRHYYTALAELNLVQLVQKPTHLHPSPTYLDHVITNIDPAPTTTVLDTDISDHQPVIVEALIGRLRRRATYRVTRSWRTADWDAICLDFLLADWDSLHNSTNVNQMVNEFMKIWNEVINRHCPIRKRRIRHPDCPWLTNNQPLRAVMAKRDAARSVWRALRTPEAAAEYRRLRNQVKSQLAQARRDYLARQLAETDRGAFWQQLKRLYMSPAPSARAPLPTDADQQRELADRFNAYFANVGSNIAAEFQEDVTAHRIHPRPPAVIAGAFKPRPITLPELSRAIAAMNSSGAVGPDGVSLSVVKRCLPVLAPHLLRLVNTSIVTRAFPESWKVATVVPIFKSGDPTVPSNFRPISLLSHLSKVTEKVVCDQLSSYLAHHNALNDCQFAYRHGHSTEDAVLSAVDWVSQAVDEGEICTITTADLSKAFDSVDHGVLLAKLGWYGIDSSWFASYLSGRSQVVRGGTSTPLPVTHGVPQGSIAGPILFSLLVNDLPCYLSCKVISYADDTQLLDRSKPDDLSLSALQTRTQATLAIMENWFRTNSLKMNAKKTDFILLGTRTNVKKTQNFHLRLESSIMMPSRSLRLLGVVIDPVLSWEHHISQVVKRCNCILISLYRFRHNFTQDTLKLLIQTHVFPHILYCLSAWGGATKTQLTRIQKIINFAARVVTGARRSDRIGPALQTLGWHRVEELVEARDVSKVSRSLQCGPPAVRNMFVARSVVSQRATRSSEAGNLHLPRCQLEQTKRSFRYRAVVSWNSRQTCAAVTENSA